MSGWAEKSASPLEDSRCVYVCCWVEECSPRSGHSTQSEWTGKQRLAGEIALLNERREGDGEERTRATEGCGKGGRCRVGLGIWPPFLCRRATRAGWNYCVCEAKQGFVLLRYSIITLCKVGMSPAARVQAPLPSPSLPFSRSRWWKTDSLHQQMSRTSQIRKPKLVSYKLPINLSGG